MTKTILAVILAATAFTANAKVVNTVCGDHAVTAISNSSTSVFERIVMDNVSYEGLPTLERKVEDGRMVTYLYAADVQTGSVAAMRVDENGTVVASLFRNDKEVWMKHCRDMN